MKYGIIALTGAAVETGNEIQNLLGDCVLYVLPRFLEEGRGSVKPVILPFGDFAGTLLRRHRVLVFIMATGIVVRSIAPHLQDKTKDPAVIVVDEKGQFVISLLSGHIGGANGEAELIATKIGATPVITTSSDLNGKTAVDQLALKYNCAIEDMKRAKEITAQIVNNEKVLLQSDFSCVSIPEYLHCPPGEACGTIKLSCRPPTTCDIHSVQLFPRIITAGLGCRKNTDAGTILSFIQETMDGLDLDIRCLKALATIDIKEDNISPVARNLGIPLMLFNRVEISNVEHLFTASEFVRESIGVAGVCEPSAYLGSDRSGNMILKKMKGPGITMALWQEELKERI